MKNWSVDTTELKKDPEKYTIWRLEQMLNFGLDGEKVDELQLRKYLPRLNLDPDRRAYLEFLFNA